MEDKKLYSNKKREKGRLDLSEDLLRYTMVSVPDKEPHRCPVCNGKGIVPNGFYSSTGESWVTASLVPETCRACNGKGYIWG